MKETEMSFEAVVNDPVYQAEADLRQAQAASFEQMEQEYKEGQKRAREVAEEKKAERRIRLRERETYQYTLWTCIMAMLAFYTAIAGCKWLDVVAGIAAAVVACIACFGWGTLKEMKRQ